MKSSNASPADMVSKVAGSGAPTESTGPGLVRFTVGVLVVVEVGAGVAIWFATVGITDMLTACQPPELNVVGE